MAATTTIPNNGLETVTNNLTKDYRYAKRKARIGFRSIAVASETAALAAAIAVAAGIGPWQVSAISIPILVWALMWNSAEFITICINRGGIHPIANLIADLLLVFKLATAAAFACTWYTIYDGQIDTDKFCLVGTDYSTTSKDYHPPVDCTLWRVTLVCIGFTLLACVCHFILFVFDAVAIHRWRKVYRERRSQALQPQPHILYITQQPTNLPQETIPSEPAPVSGRQDHISMPPPPPGMMYVAVPQPTA